MGCGSRESSWTIISVIFFTLGLSNGSELSTNATPPRTKGSGSFAKRILNPVGGMFIRCNIESDFAVLIVSQKGQLLGVSAIIGVFSLFLVDHPLCSQALIAAPTQFSKFMAQMRFYIVFGTSLVEVWAPPWTAIQEMRQRPTLSQCILGIYFHLLVHCRFNSLKRNIYASN